MSGLPYMNLNELALLFGYKDAKNVRRAIQRGNFELPTYKIHGRIVADTEVVKEFFATRRAEGLRALADISE
jgi:hypothetical protein